MSWQVWIQSQDFNGSMSYIYPFTVFDDTIETAESALDYVPRALRLVK
jgi:hypothetical protein